MARHDMRILFYLPVVTPWWFDAIVAPIIRAATRGAEVHVMVPPLWRNTGITADQLEPCADLEQVHWHILDGEGHERLRTSAAGDAELLALVHDIDPDLTLCRSADLETPSQFPGIVRYIMEGAAPPFRNKGRAVYLTKTLFDHAMLPDLAAEDRAWLDREMAPAWDTMHSQVPDMDRAAFLEAAGLPADKSIIALPLEYEHDEMFFGQHNVFESNIALIDAVATDLPDDVVIAITNHPLNERSGAKGPLRRALRRHAGKVHLVGEIGAPGDATLLLTRHSDGMIVGNSKSFAGCAFFQKPMLRLTRFATGAWMGASDDVSAFIAAVRAGTAFAPSEADARAWFGFHLANNAFDPADPTLDSAALLGRAINPVNSGHWAKELEPYLSEGTASAVLR